MEKGELSFISQLVNTLHESEPKLEEFYRNKDTQKFNEMKKFILRIQKEIDGELQ
ncbi:MAG: hypothetical protein ABFQ65_02510 [Nanoarchaeota archaeon]